MNGLRNNLLASIVLFLVAIPLNLGIALASGVSAVAGLTSGVVGGLVVAPLAGSPLMVSGPATGLIAMIWQITERHGPAALGLVVFAAGLLQMMIGFFRLGPWFRAVSPAVIQGMLAGIGILIFASQFHVMLNSKPTDSGWKNLSSLPGVAVRMFQTQDPVAMQSGLLGFITIAVIFFWPLLGKRARTVPASLPAVLTAVLLAAVFQPPVRFVTLPSNWRGELALLSPESLSGLATPDIWGTILALTFIATAQTLLTATAVDRLHTGPRTDYDREVIAQGAGNTLCGFLGVLPVAGVIVRSAAGVQAGSKGREASLLHAVWLVVFLAFFTSALSLIPIASLAAVLVFTGIRLCNLDAARGLGKFGRIEQWIYLATLVSVVGTDLLTGILVGFGLSALRLLYILTHCQCEVREDVEKGLLVLELSGSATIFTLPSLTRTLDNLLRGREVHVFVSHLDYIDHACLEYILGWEEQYISAGGQAYIEWDRLVRRFQRSSEKSGPDAMMIGQDYESVVARGLFFDLDSSHDWPGMVSRISSEFETRLGSGAKVLQERLHFKLEEGGGAFSLGALVMGLRLPGFAAHEMVVVRCPEGLNVPDPVTGSSQRIYCFILLLGSQEQPDEHLKILASLIARVAEGPMEAWRTTESVQKLKEKFLQHRQFVNLTLAAGHPSELFIQKALWQLSGILPPEVLVVTVKRDGDSIIPKGGTVLRDGDVLTIVGQPAEIEKLFRKYVIEEEPEVVVCV